MSAYQHVAVPASEYTYKELADIYNQARVDYIIPMPMNARRMEEYVLHYDIVLEGSPVAIDPDDGQPNAIGMLGMRDDRGWITRLGVLPERRRHHTGQFLMQQMIDYARDQGCRLMQLEVIKGNEPAHHLFLKLGFELTRELMIIRRPPGKLPDALKPMDGVVVETVEEDEELAALLAEREPGASWVEETASLLNIAKLRGLRATLPDGETGWIIFQRTPFQLTHFVLKPGISPQMVYALLAQIHSHYPLQDTKVENMPINHETWTYFQRYGYVEAFRRLEMFLYFDKPDGDE